MFAHRTIERIFTLTLAALAWLPASALAQMPAYFRITSDQPTRITWIDAQVLTNFYGVDAAWCAILWSNQAPRAEAYPEIAFSPQGAWASNNFFFQDLRYFDIDTNAPTGNPATEMLARALQQLDSDPTLSGILTTDVPTDYWRGEIYVGFQAAVTWVQANALVESHGHRIWEWHYYGSLLCTVRVPYNEELLWATRYRTNAIVQYAELSSILHGLTSFHH